MAPSGNDSNASCRRTFLLCLLALALSACGALSKGNHDLEALTKAAQTFNKGFRWEEYAAAAAWVAPSAKVDFWEHADRMQGHVRVMDTEIRDVYLKDNPHEGMVIVRCRVFYKNNPQVQVKTLHQKWRFSPKEKTWQVVDPDIAKLTP